ncbi:ATP-binding cassette domain-containing protein [Nitratireductor pacificus]|uniref:ABC transporter n=1 Tax=Nitratireductor pacificus pht-3B TaxID=391937 RepID=K2MEE0_9HYPH|nr:ATP-binding cassette domain-containing protein [Nitratireductor pacificus]EKF20536.1 ABC transporter [Nitratireductor pacificus pht-3B]
MTVPAENPSLFELENVSFSVPGRALLSPLTSNLPGGKVIGLIGQNGSGKSTLLKILARQQPPSDGSLRFRGTPLRAWSDRELARALAYLPQQTPAAGGMLVKELVALGRYPWHGALGRFGPKDRAQVDKAIALTGLESLADRLVDTLSGGERQRAWIAMLIAQDAGCMLLDEPISALDVAHQVEILDLVHGLSRKIGLSVVIVLHDINMAARFCDEIIALHSGRLVACGPPDKVMTTDTLRCIYGIEMALSRHPRTGCVTALPC